MTSRGSFYTLSMLSCTRLQLLAAKGGSCGACALHCFFEGLRSDTRQLQQFCLVSREQSAGCECTQNEPKEDITLSSSKVVVQYNSIVSGTWHLSYDVMVFLSCCHSFAACRGILRESRFMVSCSNQPLICLEAACQPVADRIFARLS